MGRHKAVPIASASWGGLKRIGTALPATPCRENCKAGADRQAPRPSALEPARPGCSGGIESLRRWPRGAPTQRNHQAQRGRAQDGGAAVVLKADGSVNIRGTNINNRKQPSNARQGVQPSNP
jgi:hypothetical protein